MRKRFESRAARVMARLIPATLLLVALAGFGSPRLATAAAIELGDQPPTAVNLVPPSPGSHSRLAPEPSPDAACVITVLPTNLSTSANSRAPSTRNRYARSVYLITATEMAASGFTSGSQPTTIGWDYSTSPVTGGTGTLIVYMQNTTDVTNLKSTTWATAITGMTIAHNAATTLPGTAGTFDITLAGAPLFTYTGGGLYIAFDWQYPTGTQSTTAGVYCSNTLAGGLKGAQSQTAPPTTTAASDFRPETRLTPAVASVNNDASVDFVMAMGAVPLDLVGPQTVQAVITCRGANPLTDLPVTIDVTGTDTFSFTGTIPSLAACGGSVVVTFPSFSLSALGSDVITVSIPSDEVPGNNSVSKTMDVTRSLYSYKHPGTTGAGGVGVNNATAALVDKFTATEPVTIKAVNLEFAASGTQTYRVAIYDDAGGVPALTPLYVDAADRTVLVAGAVTITLPSPVTTASGVFYAGIQQTGIVNASLSYDAETPIRSGAFYGATPLPVTSWFDFSPGNNFKMNIGVTLDRPPQPIVIAPNGGEEWVTDDVQQITWTATDDAVVSIDLDYSIDGGATYPFSIATGLANSGTYDWTIPDVETDSARVRMTAHDDGPADFTAVDASDANFKIKKRTGVPAMAETLIRTPNGLTVYPNPAGAQGAHVLYRLANAHVGDVAIYEVSGRLVRRLASGSSSAGSHELVWDGSDQSGKAAAAGVYMVRFQAQDGLSLTHRFVLQR